MTFQMTFAIITPALIVGAFAERMKFSAMLWFMALWFTIVYLPIAHMVWGGDGGSCGTWACWTSPAARWCTSTPASRAWWRPGLGKRKGYPTTAMPPHNLGYTLIGASMLWVGWFGFNAGSAVAADGAPAWPCW
jgi:ammonium transporter, Amt family